MSNHPNGPNKIYFASDFHLGAPNTEKSKEREKQVIYWLEEVRKDATEIFLMGDVFDFWFTYKTVVPKGYTRLFGKLAEIADQGIPVHYFSGNHDLWGLDYFEKELGLKIHQNPIERIWNGKNFLIGHGDGLGPGDASYKLLKKYVFLNPFAQWVFAHLHPDFGIWIATSWSSKSRLYKDGKEGFLGEDKEWLVQYCIEQSKIRENETEKNQKIDYYIFGHRHLPLDITLPDGSRYINLGDWINHYTYGLFDGEDMHLENWKIKP